MKKLVAFAMILGLGMVLAIGCTETKPPVAPAKQTPAAGKATTPPAKDATKPGETKPEPKKP
jgi:hypothetical protein